MTEQVDILRELIDRLLAAAAKEGRFTPEVALSVEREFRREYKGLMPYIGERPARYSQATKAKVVDAYLQNMPIDKIINENGISRATLYRFLKK